LNVASVTVLNLKKERTTPITIGIRNAIAKQIRPGSANKAKYFCMDFCMRDSLVKQVNRLAFQ
jgi:hypothetical protein